MCRNCPGKFWWTNRNFNLDIPFGADANFGIGPVPDPDGAVGLPDSGSRCSPLPVPHPTAQRVFKAGLVTAGLAGGCLAAAVWSALPVVACLGAADLPSRG